MSTTQSDVTVGDRKARTITLTDDERYAAVYALADDAKRLVDTIADQYGTFANAGAEGWEVPALDLAGQIRMLSHLLPTLDALAEREIT